jgi:hypothetical protein
VLFLAAASFVVLGLAGPAPIAESIKEALTNGDVRIDLRYRFEQVDRDSFFENAAASTARLRLGYETSTYHGFFASAAFQGLWVVGSERYNSTANGKTQFPAVPDPEDEELYEGFLGHSGLKETTFKLGRQGINLDNQRFVGTVDFRQLGQTFDAFSVESGFAKPVALYYSHVNKVKRIFGSHHPTSALAETDMNTDLLNASFKSSVGILVGYAYFLEFEDLPAASHRDLGLRFTGRHAFSDRLSLLYTAEYADQADYEDGASFIDVGYYFLEPGIKIDKFNLKLGYEVLEGNGSYGFQTPLGTNHAFNGWTDQFAVVTPPNGLKDLYFKFSTALDDYRLIVVYHDFSSDAGSLDYGREWGWLFGKTFKKAYTVRVKFADYDARDFSADTRKLWLTLQVKI